MAVPTPDLSIGHILMHYPNSPRKSLNVRWGPGTTVETALGHAHTAMGLPGLVSNYQAYRAWDALNYREAVPKTDLVRRYPILVIFDPANPP